MRPHARRLPLTDRIDCLAQVCPLDRRRRFIPYAVRYAQRHETDGLADGTETQGCLMVFTSEDCFGRIDQALRQLRCKACPKSAAECKTGGYPADERHLKGMLRPVPHCPTARSAIRFFVRRRRRKGYRMSAFPFWKIAMVV